MSFPLEWQRKYRFIVITYFAVSSQSGKSLQTMSCKRFRVGQLFNCYKGLWRYRATSLCIQHCHKFKPSLALKLQRNYILSWRGQLKMQMRGKHNPLPTQNCLFRSRSFSTATLSGCAVPRDLAECRTEPMGRRLSLHVRNCCSEW